MKKRKANERPREHEIPGTYFSTCIKQKKTHTNKKSQPLAGEGREGERGCRGKRREGTLVLYLLDHGIPLHVQFFPLPPAKKQQTQNENIAKEREHSEEGDASKAGRVSSR